jgi:hypothetical protein
MKLFLFLSFITILSTSSGDCNKKDKQAKYQGRLEIKGICMNYTISVIGENPDLEIEKNWKDEASGKSYSNVFALGNPCQFPKQLNQGDTFYFTIDSSIQEACMVCEAYAPKPSKKLDIKVEMK